MAKFNKGDKVVIKPTYWDNRLDKNINDILRSYNASTVISDDIEGLPGHILIVSDYEKYNNEKEFNILKCDNNSKTSIYPHLILQSELTNIVAQLKEEYFTRQKDIEVVKKELKPLVKQATALIREMKKIAKKDNKSLFDEAFEETMRPFIKAIDDSGF
jgi:hypothetical protein